MYKEGIFSPFHIVPFKHEIQSTKLTLKNYIEK